MSFVEAKCTRCGANIRVDATKEAGICPYCGTAFITEKAISNYNVVNNTTIQNATINVNKILDDVKLETIYICRGYDGITKKVDVLVDDKIYALIEQADVIEIKIEKDSYHRIQCVIDNEKSNVLFIEKGEIVNITISTFTEEIEEDYFVYSLEIEKTNETKEQLEDYVSFSEAKYKRYRSKRLKKDIDLIGILKKIVVTLTLSISIFATIVAFVMLIKDLF